MSGFTQTTNELLYSYYAASTPSTPLANPGSSMIVGYPPIIIPANYFTNTGSRTSSLRLEMGGLCSVTAVAWQFFLYTVPLTTAAPAFATTNTLGTTNSFTPGQTATNFVWECVINIGIRTLALGQNSTIAAVGRFMSDAFLPASYSVTAQTFVAMPATGAYTPFATYDTSQAWQLWPGLGIASGTAGNTVTTQYCKLFGEN